MSVAPPMITIFVNMGFFQHFETVTHIGSLDTITHIFENVVRCKYFGVGVHIKNTTKNSHQDSLGRTTQTLDYVVAWSIY